MTLPSTAPLSSSQIENELGLSFPFSLDHPWILALAGKINVPISFSDLLGKTGRYDGSLATIDKGGVPDTLQINFPNSPFFDIHAQYAQYYYRFGYELDLWFDVQGTYWAGKNIMFKNNTTGAQVVLSPYGSGSPNLWISNSSVPNLIRAGATDNYTILPSN